MEGNEPNHCLTMANPLLCRAVWFMSLVILVGTEPAAAFRSAVPRPSAGLSTARMSSTFTTSSDESVESKEQPVQRRVQVEEKFARYVWIFCNLPSSFVLIRVVTANTALFP